MIRENELYVVDENGEILDTISSADNYVKLSDGDKVVRKGVLQYLSDTKDIKYKFIKINPLIWGDVTTKYPILNYLIYYIGYMDNILVYKNGKNIQMKDIYKLCNVSESTAKRQIKKLLEDDIIHKVKSKKKTTYLVVNPYICMRGRRIYITLYEEFKNSIWKDKIEGWDK